MNRTQKDSNRGPVWKSYRQERRRKRILKLIQSIIVGCVAWYAMETNQAALWLTFPAILWSFCIGAVNAELLLTEGKW